MFDPRGTILGGLPVATLQRWLTEAQCAYAELVMGRKSVSVSYDGKAVTYTAASRGDLENFIGLLQKQLGQNKGRRALRPYF
jgi:hypothetical protein